MEEGIGVGEEGAGLGEDLGVGRPAEALVALRAVGRDREIIGALTPYGVGYELVDALVAGLDLSNLKILSDGGDGDGLDAADCDVAGRRDGGEPVAEEGAAGSEGDKALLCAECVVQDEALIGDTEIEPVDRAFRAVHSAALGAVAVVEELAAEEGQLRAFRCGEFKCGHCRGVLAEVHNEGLSLGYLHRSAGGVLPEDDDLAESLFRGVGYFFPHIGAHGLQRNVLTLIDLRTVAGEYLAGELVVDDRGGELLRSEESGELAGVVLFAVEDGRVLDGTGDAGLPGFGVGAEEGGRAVLIGHLKDSSECAALADHSLVASRGDDLVGPPSGSDLGGKGVDRTGAALECVSDVVGI